MGVVLDILDEDLHTDQIEVTGFANVSAGDHTMQIVEIADAATKKGDGRMLKLQWQVVDETDSDHGRCLFQYINYRNSSAEAERIGREQLKQICDAVGYSGSLSGIELDDVLCNRSCLVTVKMSKGDEQYGPSAKVRRVRPLPMPGARQTPTAQPSLLTQITNPASVAKPASGGVTRPWPKKGVA